MCDCAVYSEFCNLLKLDKFPLALNCIMSLRTRHGKLEKVLKFEDYSLKKVDRNEINTAW